MSKTSARFEVHRPVKKATESKPRDKSLRVYRICKREHAIWKCPKFHKMSVGKRWKEVMKYRYCFNCLAHSHIRDKRVSRERYMELGQRNMKRRTRKSTK